MMENINRDDWQRTVHDNRPTSELIQSALLEIQDDEGDWSSYMELRYRGWLSDFEAARNLCKSTPPNERVLGAGILASPQRQPIYIEESVQILLKMLESEQHPEVLNAIGIALGHLNDARAIKPLIKLKNHPDAEVRFGVVFGLLGHEDDLAIQTLLAFLQDTDEKVRDYANFGLALQIDTDTPEIRDALLKNLDDPNEDVHYEAFEGLAIRKDKRIVARAIDELISGKIEYGSSLADTLCEMLTSLQNEIQDNRLPQILEKCVENA